MSSQTSSPDPSHTFSMLDRANPLSREALVRVGMALGHRLLEGRPVSVDTLAEATGRPQDELDQFLNRLEAERNENGEVVGLGLSLRPTAHQYETDGKIFYGWCAPDTLIYPPLFQHTARVRSRDPITGAAVKLTVTRDAVEQVDPSSAAVTWVEDGTPSSLRESFCRPGRFFADASAAQQWTAERERVTVYPVGEAHEAARTIASRLREWGSADQGD